MDMTADRLLVWAPRILGIGLALFLALFALDAVGSGRPLAGAAAHLVPSLIVLAVVGAAWRWPLGGALALGTLAVAYAATVPGRRDWILAISGPLLLVAATYLWSWWRRAA